LRVTAVTSGLAGTVGILATLAISTQPVDHSAPPILLMLLVWSLISWVGGSCILLVPMRENRRGIVGFIVFVISVPLLLGFFSVLGYFISGPR